MMALGRGSAHGVQRKRNALSLAVLLVLVIGACSPQSTSRIIDFTAEDNHQLEEAKNYIDTSLIPMLMSASTSARLSRVYKSGSGYVVESYWSVSLPQSLESISDELSHWLSIQPVGSSGFSGGFCIAASQNPNGRKPFPYSRTLLMYLVQKGAIAARLSLTVERPWWRGGDVTKEIGLRPIAYAQNSERYCIVNGSERTISSIVRDHSEESVLTLKGELIQVPKNESSRLLDRTPNGGAQIIH